MDDIEIDDASDEAEAEALAEEVPTTRSSAVGSILLFWWASPEQLCTGRRDHPRPTRSPTRDGEPPGGRDLHQRHYAVLLQERGAPAFHPSDDLQEHIVRASSLTLAPAFSTGQVHAVAELSEASPGRDQNRRFGSCHSRRLGRERAPQGKQQLRLAGVGLFLTVPCATCSSS